MAGTALLALLLGSSPAARETPVYTSRECGVSFHYPTRWRVVKVSGAPCLFEVSSVRKNIDDTVAIRVEPGSIDDELTDIDDIDRPKAIAGPGWRGVSGTTAARCSPRNIPGTVSCDLRIAVIGTAAKWAQITDDGATTADEFGTIVERFTFSPSLK
jgi:hypothetical protein